MHPRTGAHVFTVNTTTRPAELYLLAPGKNMRRITRVSDFVELRYAAARQERLTWKGQAARGVRLWGDFHGSNETAAIGCLP